MAARTSVWGLRHGAQHRQARPNGGRYAHIVHKPETLRQKARAPTRRALNPALVGDAESKSLRSGRAVRTAKTMKRWNGPSAERFLANRVNAAGVVAVRTDAPQFLTKNELRFTRSTWCGPPS